MICEREKCTGCFACYNVCPKGAINMVEDIYGYIYPIIDKNKCINCNLCKKVCPSLNKVVKTKPLKCYAVVAKDKKILSKSTSGGIATVLAKKIISENGVVYGAAYIDEKCTVAHIRIESVKDLTKLQGSKYVHSYILGTYKNVKEDLNKSRKVLFIGTPCQIAGLKSFLRKEL